MVLNSKFDKKEYLKYKGTLVTVQQFKAIHKRLEKAKSAPKKKVVKRIGGIADKMQANGEYWEYD
jgi:hypothetical protein